MHIRLTKKLAEVLNGLDLRDFRVGQVINLTDTLAQMLIAERWAEAVIAFDTQATADERGHHTRARSASPMTGSSRRKAASPRTKP